MQDINKIRHLARYNLGLQFPMSGGKKNDKKRWDTLKHNGVLFPPEYVPHNIPIIYDGEMIILNPFAEEVATFYAKYLDTEYVKDKVFNKNYWKDFKKYLKGDEKKIVDFDKCSFKKINEYLLQLKMANMDKSQKLEKKKITDEIEAPYKVAFINDKPQQVGNFRMEPPGLFLGRGCHPKRGMVKPRLYPKDVIINIGKNEKVPEPNIPGKWKKVIHDKYVEWLASWNDPISGKNKYVWLGSQSEFKAESDLKKFNLARDLKKKIKDIRKVNNDKIINGKPYEKQIATALYFIDNLALRVGNEKGEDEADTVGVTSLRVEHIMLNGNNEITLDFLGKDSIRYVKKFNVDPNIYINIEEFSKNKNKDENLFDLISSHDLNKYLQSFMKNLTAKVFRTYNASNLFQKELKSANKKLPIDLEGTKLANYLYDEYNKANAKVALLCNHQKKISDSFNKQLDKINDKIKELKKVYKNENSADKKKKIKNKIKELKAKRVLKSELKGVSLGTSKTNYIDPRITISYMKKHKISIDKLFSKTLQDKFWWAMEVDENFKF